MKDTDLTSTAKAALKKALDSHPLMVRSHILDTEEPPPSPLYHVDELLPELSTQATLHRQASSMAVYKQTQQTDSEDAAPLALAAGERLESLPAGYTLQSVLKHAAEQEHRGIVFLQADGSEQHLSYAELRIKAERLLSGLRQCGVRPGDSVLIQCSCSEQIVSLFWACILGGFLATPIAVASAYDEMNPAVAKLYHSWQLLEHPWIVSDGQLYHSIRGLQQLWEETELSVAAYEQLVECEPDEDWHQAQPQDKALNLLTSGSTGKPKCVQHRHASILARSQAATQRHSFTEQEIILNWMPLDHVGGIVMKHALALFLACDQIIAKVDSYLERPLNWLDWMDRYRVTVTWAPNFAFALLNQQKRLVQASASGWNLSCVRQILNAGEAIVPQTARQFMELLSPFGLSEEAMHPAWGMSETSSAIVYSHSFRAGIGQGGSIRVDKESLSSTIRRVEAGHPSGVEFTVLGKPVPGVSLRIVDEHNQLLREWQVGRLQACGPTIMQGYYNNEQANEEVFVGDGWFNTGDLGFLYQGQLVLTGRQKDLIIVNGKNFLNYELESHIENIEGVEATYAAACAVQPSDDQPEQLIVFFVPERQEPEYVAHVVRHIRSTLSQQVGITPASILPISKEEFPKTNSGKIQRHELQSRYMRGECQALIQQYDLWMQNERTLPDWIFAPAWRDVAPKSRSFKRIAEDCLLFADTAGLTERLAIKSGLEHAMIWVRTGQSFRKIDQRQYEIVPGKEQHYSRLLEECEADGLKITGAVHAWLYDTDEKPDTVATLNAMQNKGAYSLIHLLKAAAAHRLDALDLCLVTRHACEVEQADPLDFTQATAISILKTIAREFPSWSCKHIDFGSEGVEEHAERLAAEWSYETEELSVAYRSGVRKLPVIEKVKLKSEQDEPIPFKHGEFYIITGGLGGIGVELARFLLESYQARLLLIGRSPLPNHSQLEQSMQGDGRAAQQLQNYTELTELAMASGGEIVYVTANLSDQEELEQVVASYERHFGQQLAGVIHLAGILHRKLLAEEQESGLEQMFEAKVYGTHTLWKLLQRYDDPLFILTSSLGTLANDMMLGAYNAANYFVEQLASFIRRSGASRVYCFAWGMWADTGMNQDTGEMEVLLRQRGYIPIGAQQGIYSLLCGLKTKRTVLYVGLDEAKSEVQSYTGTMLPKRRTAHIYYEDRRDESNKQRRMEDRGLEIQLRHRLLDAWSTQEGNAPELRFYRVERWPLLSSGEIDEAALASQREMGEYDAPATELEIALAKLWSPLLHGQQVGRQSHFFAMGGHSLIAARLLSAAKDTFGVTLTLHELFRYPTLSALAACINEQRQQGKLVKEAEHSSFDKRRARPLRLTLSYEQRQQWRLHRLHPTSPFYNTIFTVTISGKLHREQLERALGALVARHESLRTELVADGEDVYQIVRPSRAHTLNAADLRELELEARQSRFEQLCSDEANRPFDLLEEPLLRTLLVQLEDERHELIVTMHHIISDGWSVSVWVQDLARFCDTLPQGDIPAVIKDSEDVPQYADYTLWQQQWTEQEACRLQLEYWKSQYADGVPQLEMPSDFKRPSVPSYQGKVIEWTADADMNRSIIEWCQAHECTPYMLLLSVYAMVLHRYSGQEEFVVGTVFANRSERRWDSMIGFCANTLPIRMNCPGHASFLELLAWTKEAALGAYAHQNVPYEIIASELKLAPDTSQHPLIQVMFVLQNMELHTVRTGQLELTPQIRYNDTAKFDLSLQVHEGDTFRFCLEYSTDLFGDAAMERLKEHYMQLLQSALATPEYSIAQMPLLTESERAQWMAPPEQIGYPQHATLHGLFEEQVRRTPGHIAVSLGSEQLTYADLDQRANALAELLVEKGADGNPIIALLLDRSLDMVVGMLGILKAGGAYLPIDPAYPLERIEYMLTDSGASMLVTSGSSVQEWAQIVPTLDIGQAPEAPQGEVYCQPVKAAMPRDLCYIIYTSGTTGQPKGVMIEHRNVVRLLFNDRFGFDFHSRDVWTLFHSYCFDFSVWEMYGALLYGGRLVIVPRSSAVDPAAFLELLRQEQVTILNQTPTAFYSLIREALQQQEQQLALRCIIFGGEALQPIQLKEWRRQYPQTKLINMYGITETTVHVTCKEIGEAEIDRNISDIGPPIPTLHVYVMDSMGQPLPYGIPGELYVGGEGLARGYLNRPELTAQRFVTHPFLPGQRLYRSGDLVKLHADGALEYMGRIDHQVKVRGFRIELGEIEHQLVRHESIREAVVLAREDEGGLSTLCAYYVAEQSLDSARVREYLMLHLPEYMVPGALIQLDSIPITSNGKVDRKRLPAPQSRYAGAQYDEPQTAMESRLAQIWQEVLGIGRIGASDSFFEWGGDSIRAISLISKVQSIMKTSLPVRLLYQYPSVRLFAHYLEQNQKTDGFRGLKEAKAAIQEQLRYVAWELDSSVEAIYPMSDIEQGMVYYSKEYPELGMYHDQLAYRLQDESFHPLALQQALAFLVRRHPNLRTCYRLNTNTLPLRITRRDREVKLERVKLTALTPESQAEEIRQAMETDRVERPFQAEAENLWRACVFEHGAGQFTIIWSCHHAIMDGWSVATFMTEWMQAYLQLKRGEQLEWPELCSDYRHYVDELYASKQDERLRTFWTVELEDFKRLELPVSLMDQTAFGGGQTEVTSLLAPGLVEQLKQTAAACRVPLKTVYFTAFSYALHMFTYENDYIIGLVENNRPMVQDAEHMIGCFLNTVPVRLHVEAGTTWAEWLGRVQEKLIELKQYGRLPLTDIVKAAGEQAVGGNPLFDVIFNYVDFYVYDRIKQSGAPQLLTLDMELVFEKTNSYLDFMVSATDDQHMVRVLSMYPESFVTQLVEYFQSVLECIAARPQARMSKLDILTGDEQEQLFRFNRTEREWPVQQTVVELFEQRAARTPDQVALVYRGQQMTYREVQQQVDALARRLREAGVEPEQPVGVLLERSFGMVIGILAILKAGGAYVPLDPNDPTDRAAYCLEASRARCIVTNSRWMQRVPFDGAWINLEHVHTAEPNGQARHDAEPSATGLASVSEPHHLAYVLFTSGSTGRPKGVMIEHRSLTNILLSLQERYPLGAGDAYLLKTSYTFDVSITELFGWIVGDGRLVILEPGAEKEPELILSEVKAQQITHINFVPSMLQSFVLHVGRLQELSGLKYMFVAGEAFPAKLAEDVRQALPQVQLENIYGPTEVTIYATAYSLNNLLLTAVPIGKPLANTRAYIVDRNMEIQPPGVPGELCIAGSGLARGYMNRPELTAASFVPSLWNEQERLYRTGDMVRLRADGELSYEGRIDLQVKIRGFRIELDEIRTQLSSHDAVQEAAVIARKDERSGHVELVAYILCRQPVDEAEIRAFLSGRLPAYMVPACLVQLDQFPLTPSGKLDRRALPDPVRSQAEPGTGKAPRNETEARLQRIWEQVLQTPGVGIGDDFFALGGDSIKAIQIVSRFNDDHGFLYVRDVLAHGTIEQLAAHIRLPEGRRSYEQGIVRGERGLTPIEHWFFGLQLARPDYFNQSVWLSLDGRLDKKALQQAFQHVILHHDGLRMNWNPQTGNMFFNPAHEEGFELQHIDVSAISPEHQQEHVRAACIAIKSSFSIAEDRLIKAAYVSYGTERDELMITAHHLVMDGVSWRILLEDLEQAYLAHIRGAAVPAFRAKTASMTDWSRYLAEHADSAELEQERSYWEQLQHSNCHIRLTAQPSDWAMRNYRVRKGALSEAMTVKLFKEAGEAYRAEINDLLLTALARTMKEWQGMSEIIVEMESHGRHTEAVDVTRTIGWFTSMYPQRLRLDGEQIEQQVRSVKDQIRLTPNHGLGYGIHYYMKRSFGQSKKGMTPIRFNYLGQMGADQADGGESLFSMRGLSMDSETSERNDITAILDFNSWVAEGQFHFYIGYHAEAFAPQAIEQLRELYEHHLIVVAEGAATVSEPQLTASDFDAADLNEDDFMTLFE